MTLIAWFFLWGFSITNDWDASDWICQEIHNKGKGGTLHVRSSGEYGASQELSNVRMSILVKKKPRDCSYVVLFMELDANRIPVGE